MSGSFLRSSLFFRFTLTFFNSIRLLGDGTSTLTCTRLPLATMPLATADHWRKLMAPITTTHAARRAQQRGIPPLVMNWLLDYGEQTFDGHGGVVRYFSSRSIRQLEREIGRTPLRRMSEFLRCFLVESSIDGCVITIGKRHGSKHFWRH